MGQAKRRREAGLPPRGGGSWAVRGEVLFREKHVRIGGEYYTEYQPVKWDGLSRPSSKRDAAYVGPTELTRQNPLHALSAIVDEQVKLRDVTQAWVDEARRQGRTWGQIGLALGMSQQAAHKRFRGSAHP